MMVSGVSPEGEGLRAGRARKRRLWLVMGAYTAAMLTVGIVLRSIRWPGTHVPLLAPGWAAFGAAALVLIVLGFTWAYMRFTDELDYRDNLVACSAGFLFYAVAYPAWLTLWSGGLAPLPRGDLLWLGTVIAGALVYFAVKLRRWAT